MFKNLSRHLKLLYKNIFLDDYEKNFVKYCKQTKTNYEFRSTSKKYILVQIVSDYYYLSYYKSLIIDKKFSGYEIVGLWPYFQRTVRKRGFLLEICNEIYLFILDYIIFLKWKRLYKSIGIKKFERLNLNLFEKFFLLKNFNKINFYKKNIFQLKLHDIEIGDLLYDTYLRFRAQPTFLKNDKFFIQKLYVKANAVYSKLDKIYKKYQFLDFYTSYSSYLHHGLPVRFFLKKNVNVFSGANNSQYNKKLSLKDKRHSETYQEFKSLINEVKYQSDLLKISSDDLNLRFSDMKHRKNKMKYLLTDTYKSEKNSNIDLSIVQNLDGVIFLQDFYDSPHDWGKLVFDDFYKWTIYSLNIIKKNNLKIGIKPHPNSWHNSPDSILIYERLKEKFPNITWLDKNYPNEIIFKNIDFGISCTGTVLFELAYHNIKAISCGDHPGINFNFTINAKDKIEYKNLLLNAKNLKLPNYTNNDLLIYNYLYNHKNMDAYNNLARKINLKEIDFSESKSLHQFIKRINNDHKY